MTTRLVAPCLTTVFLIVASSLFVQAQVTAPSDTSTLKGIRTVYVLIKDLRTAPRSWACRETQFKLTWN